MSDKPWGKGMGANQGGTDEWFTPVEAVMPILPFLKKGSRILCPFDTDESQYVKCLSKEHSVVYSHISQGKDFFLLDKPNVDYIISNPPYSTRTEVLKQLYKWDIPFALILNSNGLFDSVTRSLLARGGGGTVVPLSQGKVYRHTGDKKCAALSKCLLVSQYITAADNVC